MANEERSILDIREERFKLKKCGTFRCEYSTWQLLEIAVTLAALAFEAFVAGGAGGFLNGGPGSRGVFAQMTGSVVETLAEWFLALLGIVAWGFGIAFVRSGQEYSYVADEEKLTIKFPHDVKPQLVIRYDEPFGAEYKERHFLWMNLGYDIKITCNKGEFMFHCLHNSTSKGIGKKAYPFYIIEERKAAANEEYKGRYYG